MLLSRKCSVSYKQTRTKPEALTTKYRLHDIYKDAVLYIKCRKFISYNFYS